MLKELGGNGERPLADAEVSSSAVRAHLGKILGSKEFVHAESLRRFLTYTVEKTIDGESNCLKESLLGSALFGRGDAFDPRIDPIVRVQAGKLRNRLQQYYDDEGRADPLVIEFPKGGYVPVFHARPPVALEKPESKLRWGAAGLAAGLIVLVALALILWRNWQAPPVPPTFTQLTFLTDSTSAFPSISRDGRLVVFASDRGKHGNLDIFIQVVGGEGPVQLTHSPARNRQTDISPDGTRIVFESDRDGGGVYALSLLSRVEAKIADRGFNPRFSPDGSRIAYEGPQGKLYTVAAMGGLPQAVDSPDGPAHFPVWTPDGKHLLGMVTIGSTEFDWHVFPLNGGRSFSTGAKEVFRRQKLGTAAYPPMPGDWMGEHMVFSAGQNESSSLWELALSTKTLRVSGPAQRLTLGPGNHTYPRVAALATGHPRIVFVNEKIVPEISSFAANPSRADENPVLERLTQDSSLVPDGTPQFSADCLRLAFCSTRLGTRDVWFKDLKTGAETPVAANPWPEDQPVLSRDGARIAYVSQSGQGPALQLWNAASNSTRKICDDCGRPLEWMPGGERILTAGSTTARVEIWDTVHGEHHPLLPALQHAIESATVSPDGRWIAVAAGGAPEGCPNTFIVPMELATAPSCKDWIALNGVSPAWGLRWSPAGDLLYFFSARDGRRCVWAQRLAMPSCRQTGEPFAVQHFHRYQPSPWAGSGIAPAPDGRLAVWFQDAQSSIWLAELH